MATITRYVSDFSGTEVDSVERVSFSYNGENFRMDMSPSERAELAELLAPYISAGQALKADKASKPVEVGDDPRAIRASLRAHGHSVNDRGRISDDLMAKYAEIKANAEQAA